MTHATGLDALAALQWHLDHGADEPMSETPVNRIVPITSLVERERDEEEQASPAIRSLDASRPAADLIGAAQAKVQARTLAAGCHTLEELRAAIHSFDGLSIRKTATNMVFSDGNPAAHVMLVGEAPGADEDRQGKPFVGVSGQLLDKILAAIGLSRTAQQPEKSVYISNVLNWRPPGNRTPSPAEIDISSAFIERHIALVRPRCLILCGGVAAKALLGGADSITKLRGRFHDLTIEDQSIPAIATYHPAYLLRTPAQKAKVWADMLLLRQKLDN